MRKVYGMPHKEIASRLGISVSTVEKHLIKGVEQCDGYVREKMDGNATAAVDPLSTGQKKAGGVQ